LVEFVQPRGRDSQDDKDGKPDRLSGPDAVDSPDQKKPENGVKEKVKDLVLQREKEGNPADRTVRKSIDQSVIKGGRQEGGDFPHARLR